MNSEKVKEIKKALEDNKTDHLPYIDEWKCKFVEFAERLKKRTILYSGINVKHEAITADIIDEVLKEYEE